MFIYLLLIYLFIFIQINTLVLYRTQNIYSNIYKSASKIICDYNLRKLYVVFAEFATTKNYILIRELIASPSTFCSNNFII